MEPDRPSALQAPNNSARVACKTTVSGSHLRGRLSWPWGYLSVCLGANENWSTVCIFQYAQLTPSTWVITVLREFVTSLRNLAATTWASLSGGWSWSSGNHSSCGESSGGCERASVRDWLLEALFFCLETIEKQIPRAEPVLFRVGHQHQFSPLHFRLNPILLSLVSFQS